MAKYYELKKPKKFADPYDIVDVLPKEYNNLKDHYSGVPSADVPTGYNYSYNPYTEVDNANVDSGCIGKMPIGMPEYLENLESAGSGRVWFTDFSELFDSQKFGKIVPRTSDTEEEQLNALMRLGIYISILMAFYKNKLKYLMLILIFAIGTLYMYINKIKVSDIISYFVGVFYNVTELVSRRNILPGIQQQPQMQPQMQQPQPQPQPQPQEPQPQMQSQIQQQPQPGSQSRQAKLAQLVNKTYTKLMAPDKEPKPYDYYLQTVDKYAKVKQAEGARQKSLKYDMICAHASENETTGGYDWIHQNEHADYRSNGRLMNTAMRNKLFTDINTAYGAEIASRNSYPACHSRDYTNTDLGNFLYGDNMDRNLYYFH